MQIQAKRYNLNFSCYTENELEKMAKKGDRLILTQKEIEEVEDERKATARSSSGVTANSYNERLIHLQKLYESAIRFPKKYQECINISAIHDAEKKEKINSRVNVNPNNGGLSNCRFFTAAVAVGVVAAVVLSGASPEAAPKK